jgi:hypothetical protein
MRAPTGAIPAAQLSFWNELLDRAAQEHGPSADSELRECPDERDQDEGEKPEAENEVAAHRLQDGPRPWFLPCARVCRPSAREQISATERREARMYVGFGTILLIVLIIILLIWVF